MAQRARNSPTTAIPPSSSHSSFSRSRDAAARRSATCRSEEHTSELQSQSNLVCRLLLEKKKRGLVQMRTRVDYIHSEESYVLNLLKKFKRQFARKRDIDGKDYLHMLRPVVVIYFWPLLYNG